MPAMTSLATQSPVAVLSASLESVGWRILALEIDMMHETARIEVRRHDGLNVTFDARNGKASLTREMIVATTIRVGRRGDIARVERVRRCFVGRTSGMGARQGLRLLCDYLGDNATRVLPAGHVRDLFRPLMDGTVHRS